ncbi:hypothetical protein MUK42_26823, partial [Musa troglodytarum]
SPPRVSLPSTCSFVSGVPCGHGWRITGISYCFSVPQSAQKTLAATAQSNERTAVESLTLHSKRPSSLSLAHLPSALPFSEGAREREGRRQEGGGGGSGSPEVQLIIQKKASPCLLLLLGCLRFRHGSPLARAPLLP